MANPVPVTYSVDAGEVRGGAWNHALAQFAATVQPGQCLEFSCPSLNTVDTSGARPFDQPQSAIDAAALVGESALKVLDWASMMDFDPITQRFYTAGGREISVPETGKIIWFDLRTNSWDSRSHWKPGVHAGHIYRNTTVLPEHRAVYNHHGGSGAHWDIDNNVMVQQWGDAPDNLGTRTAGWAVPKCVVWHPNMGAQGAVVWANNSWDRVLAFDWATKAWEHIVTGYTLNGNSSPWTNNHVVGHYHPLTDTVIVGSSWPDFRGRPIVVRADKTTYLTSTAPCDLTCAGSNGAIFVPHPKRRASISFCYTTKRIWSYEYDSDRWIDRAPIPASFNTRNNIGGVVFASGVIINVVYGVSGTSKIWVYRPDF